MSLSFIISLLHSDTNAPQDLIAYKAQNFFDLKPQTDADRYDLIYDYTCVPYIDQCSLRLNIIEQFLCRYTPFTAFRMGNADGSFS